MIDHDAKTGQTMELRLSRWALRAEAKKIVPAVGFYFSRFGLPLEESR